MAGLQLNHGLGRQLERQEDAQLLTRRDSWLPTTDVQLEVAGFVQEISLFIRRFKWLMQNLQFRSQLQRRNP